MFSIADEICDRIHYLETHEWVRGLPQHVGQSCLVYDYRYSFRNGGLGAHIECALTRRTIRFLASSYLGDGKRWYTHSKYVLLKLNDSGTRLRGYDYLIAFLERAKREAEALGV